jgi:MinD-like ATPase involved in chromosome partitioning or flagellar assembly
MAAMSSPEIGLAASARDWSDRFHRFLLDHGGGTMSGRIMTSEQAISTSFDVIFIDDICSFLNSRLVIDLRAAGKGIVGVFESADGSDAKRRLLEAGISDVIESDATPEEFLRIASSTVAYTTPAEPASSDEDRQSIRIGVMGPPGGVGVTEIAVGLAIDLSQRHRTVLVDFNLNWPGVGQRLGIPVHPNLRTAIDYVLHDPEVLESAMHGFGPLSVICGVANPGPSTVPASDLVGLVSGLTRGHSHVVMDMGHVPDVSPELFRSLDAVLLVGSGDPSGLTRLIRCLEIAAESTLPGCGVGLVVNRIDRAPRKRDEIVALIHESARGVPLVLIPEDHKVRRSSWDGSPISAGSFNRAIRRLGRVFDGAADDR